MNTPKCNEALKLYVTNRAKYGVCGANISLTHLKMLEKNGYIVRGPCASIQEFTLAGETLVQRLFKKD